MSLADRLRAALELGHRSSPELIGGDVLDEEALAHGVTPAAVLVAVVDRPGWIRAKMARASFF